MKNNQSTTHQVIAESLRKKYGTANAQTSGLAHQDWLRLCYDTGEEVRKMEQQVRRLDRHLQLISRHLKKEFPNVKKNRFSPANLKKMRTFYLAYRDFMNPTIWEAICQLSWQHHCRYLCRISAPDERVFYLTYAATHSWSCRMLSEEIKKDHYGRIGMPSNFGATLSPERCLLAQMVFKKAYVFAFVYDKDKPTEKELEKAFIDNLEDFLKELGPEFTFKSRQKHLKIGAKEYIYDLVLYHTALKCHIIIDIKRGKFQAEYISKMDRYLSSANKKLKGKDDNDTIGIILCMSRDDQDVEDALNSSSRPIGVAIWCVEL